MRGRRAGFSKRRSWKPRASRVNAEERPLFSSLLFASSISSSFLLSPRIIDDLPGDFVDDWFLAHCPQLSLTLGALSTIAPAYTAHTRPQTLFPITTAHTTHQKAPLSRPNHQSLPPRLDLSSLSLILLPLSPFSLSLPFSLFQFFILPFCPLFTVISVWAFLFFCGSLCDQVALSGLFVVFRLIGYSISEESLTFAWRCSFETTITRSHNALLLLPKYTTAASSFLGDHIDGTSSSLLHLISF